MQIEVNSPPKAKVKKVAIVASGLVLCVLALLYQRTLSPTVDISDISAVTVERADIDLMSNVFGQFASRYERLLTAPSSGQISEILVRAGESVKQGTVIAVISNPDLEQSLFDANAKLEEMEYNEKVEKLTRQNQRLSYESELTELESELETVELDVAVNQKLIAQGITAKLELERAVLRQSLLKKRIKFSRYRFEKLEEMHVLQAQQAELLLTQQKKQVELMSNKVKGLNLISDIDGTVQSLDVVLGQRVNTGDALAKVGSQTQLIARVNIPQRIAERIAIGHRVEIQLDRTLLKAEITQLGAVVESGFIIAEAQLLSNAPSNLRPAQPLKARVFVEHKANALLVEQHPGFKPLSANELFVHNPQSQTLLKKNIVFGELSGNKLIVNSGVEEGEQLVINSLKEWANHQELSY